MPSPKSQRKGGQEKTRKERLSGRASSFHVVRGESAAEILPRPRTVPDLLIGGRSAGTAVFNPPKLTKLLVNVTVQRSLGAVKVIVPPETTVEELIAAVLRQYVKEARSPVLPSAGYSGFSLHYSQFCLESLDKEEKLMDLGSRNFFMCVGAAVADAVKSGGTVAHSSSRCSDEAEVARQSMIPWIKFMDSFTVGKNYHPSQN